MEQPHRIIEYRHLGSSDTVVNHVGTNDLRTGNFNYAMGDVYDLVHMAKTKFSTSRVAPSSVLQRQDVSWWCIGAINCRYDWVAKTNHTKYLTGKPWLSIGQQHAYAHFLKRTLGNRLEKLCVTGCEGLNT
jgi:hypothetical protein